MTNSSSLRRASVLSVNDPAKQRRVQLAVPEITGVGQGVWAEQTDPAAPPPKVGDQVWMTFDGGDPSRPVVLSRSGANAQLTLPAASGTAISAGPTSPLCYVLVHPNNLLGLGAGLSLPVPIPTLDGKATTSIPVPTNNEPVTYLSGRLSGVVNATANGQIYLDGGDCLYFDPSATIVGTRFFVAKSGTPAPVGAVFVATGTSTPQAWAKLVTGQILAAWNGFGGSGSQFYAFGWTFQNGITGDNSRSPAWRMTGDNHVQLRGVIVVPSSFPTGVATAIGSFTSPACRPAIYTTIPLANQVTGSQWLNIDTGGTVWLTTPAANNYAHFEGLRWPLD
jgi:hypothetical protein